MIYFHYYNTLTDENNKDSVDPQGKIVRGDVLGEELNKKLTEMFRDEFKNFKAS